ncbi:MAG: putrescine/spermidine ABC transporter ATP-binding protein [Coxiella sp. RIFCSPHIGHO2_12_FULL_42_15]|nr:MAG: putrescine/spermidine ABC transporter ATP-binding protein [Coxiella sp. RIFCSPHIGHO2_12_FULL_42_15]
MALLSLNEVSKQFGDHTVLKPFNLEIRDGEFLTLLGPSGCGKTTLLRLIAGFELPDTGSILLKGHDITHIPAEKRHINMVFQSYALFPHMTVFQNIAFGLECQKLPKSDIKQRVMEVLERVQLKPFHDRKPAQLSGGQQQRVAIARAIVNEPVLLLLDEPLSALDYSLRKQMRLELKALQRRLGITFILVTHDQEEALTMSDRIVVMNHGKIEQVGKPRDVYEEPNNLFVTRFIGEANIFTTQVLKANEHNMVVSVGGVEYILKNKKGFQVGETVHIVIRPEDIEAWDNTEIDTTETLIPAQVAEVIYKGSTVDLVVRLRDGQLVSAAEFFDEDDEKLEYNIGDTVYLDWKIGWEVVLPGVASD